MTNQILASVSFKSHLCLCSQMKIYVNFCTRIKFILEHSLFHCSTCWLNQTQSLSKGENVTKFNPRRSWTEITFIWSSKNRSCTLATRHWNTCFPYLGRTSLPNSRFTGVFGVGTFLTTLGHPESRRWLAKRPFTWPEPSQPSVGQLKQRRTSLIKKSRIIHSRLSCWETDRRFRTTAKHWTPNQCSHWVLEKMYPGLLGFKILGCPNNF